jgi:Protein of unknown function (DUF3987)/Domain of unknown function (DUF6371)
MTNIAEVFAPLDGDHLTVSPLDEVWRPISPVPSDAPPLTKAFLERTASSGYTYTAAWRFLDAAGQLLGCVVRFDRAANGQPADKQIKPFTFCAGPNGACEWRCKGFSHPRPLYGLDLLASRPTARVLVVEGEKTAVAAGVLFPEFVVVTSSGGAKAAHKTNWTPVAGRDVVVWPDADEPGARYGEDVAALLLSAGAASVNIVVLPATFPAKWDLADECPAGVTMNDLSLFLAQAKPLVAVGGASWPAVAPITSTLPPVEPFIPGLLPDSLRAYVLDVAYRQQAPPDFAAVTALCGLAAAVGNRVRIRPKQNDDWEVVPNLWGANIGRPSAMKSPAMQAALAPIYAIEDELREKWHEEIEALEIDDALSGLDAKDAKKKAEKALKSGDREAARNILAGLVGGDGKPPCPRIVVNDTTVEKLGELLNENPRGLLLIRDELPGFLAHMESEEHQSERAFYLEAYNGNGRFTYDRIGRGTVHIESCTVSIIGGVQPSRIAPIVRGAMCGASNDGLIQRLQMTVWPDDVGSWRWVDRKPNAAARLAYEKVFRDLYDLAMGDADKPAILRFSPESQALFQEWTTEIQIEARSGSLPSALESHILKMPKVVASLALLFELADGGRFEVNEAATRRALGWADYLRSHANRLYSAGETMAADGARVIVKRRHQLPESFTPRDIHRKGWASLGDREAVISAIEMLVATNHCREVPPVVHQTGGRPSLSYVWNPSLKVEG